MVDGVDRRAQRAMWSGFSDALGQGVEFVGVTVLFVLGGLWLDGRFGTKPLFTVILGLLAVIGLATRSYYSYRAAMEREGRGKPWSRNNPK